jgi:imidazolonepropionase-like amidohydrolase
MGHDEAVRALTLGGAAVLGIDDRYGSLEPGKSATMILTDDDVLEVRMQVVRAWLDGREVDLESRHTELWKKWRARPAGSAAVASE